MKIVFLFCCVFSVYSVSGETVILDHFSPKVSFLNSKKRMEITPEGGGIGCLNILRMGELE